MALVAGGAAARRGLDADGRESLLAQLLPGARIGVRFADDPHHVHERILGWPCAVNSWVVLTGDGDEYAEVEDGWGAVLQLTGRSA